MPSPASNSRHLIATTPASSPSYPNQGSAAVARWTGETVASVSTVFGPESFGIDGCRSCWRASSLNGRAETPEDDATRLRGDKAHSSRDTQALLRPQRPQGMARTRHRYGELAIASRTAAVVTAGIRWLQWLRDTP